MPVVIRLMRAGAKKRPFFRMVAADSRRQRDGRFLQILGHYDPLKKPYELVVHKDKVEAWIAKGAQPSEQVASLLRPLGVQMVRASTPSSPAAEAGTKPAAKKTVKRAVPRKPSERKLRARAHRASGKKKPAVRKPKKA